MEDLDSCCRSGVYLAGTFPGASMLPSKNLWYGFLSVTKSMTMSTYLLGTTDELVAAVDRSLP